MNLEKHLILCLLFCMVFVACDEDDTPENLAPPRVDFAYAPPFPLAGDEILFYADPEDGSGDIVSWSWTFGDESGGTSDKRNPYYTFESEGDYNVTLKVLNEAGAAMEVTRVVTVLPPPPDDFPAHIAWSFTNNTPVDRYNEGSSAPVIGDDGTIYYIESNAQEASSVVAVVDQGETAELKWATEMGNDINNSPSIGPDGNLFINSWTGTRAIAKLNGQDGTIMWEGSIGTGVSNNTPAVDSEGNSYHGSRWQNPSGGAYSWSPTGEKRWEILGVGAFYAAPVLSSDESTVYFLNTNEGKIWAVNTADGTMKWDASVGLPSGIHGTSLSMGADGTIYFTTNTHVAAVTDEGTTGALKWSVQVNDASNSGVVIGPNGELYTGSEGGLLSLDPATGAVVWNYEAEIVESVPAVDVHGNIYVGTSAGELIIVNPQGNLLKALELGNDVVHSPTITDDGTVFVEVTDNMVIKLYKITVEGGGPADSPWPMKGQNVKSTGVAP